MKLASLLAKAEQSLLGETHLAYADKKDAALEARILFEFVSGKTRAWQIAHSSDAVDDTEQEAFNDVIRMRCSGRPIAYITGKQAFWDLSLEVNSSTLIPRQDTETLIELAISLQNHLPDNARVLDLGTGTGAIALALKKECPHWRVIGIDTIEDAVMLARRNASINQLEVEFFQSAWFEKVKIGETDDDDLFSLIVSNPPYVEQGSSYLWQGDLRFEPLSALTSGEDGLKDIREIIQQAPAYLLNGGLLMLEHGFAQAKAIRDLLSARGFKQIETRQDYNQIDRVSFGWWSTTN
uniref:peptide chain release factor N(5)-glutamine methyltransferase n=1 Tax=Ningiella ruwaisensis TaxID=2364274 RepID=UPI0010A0C021|nr:peptide chain release factor N(5)-glutamine methyltransferase [Ningiella ruwaisensis]